MMYNQKLKSVGEEEISLMKPKRFIERFKCVSKSSCLWHYGGYSVGVPPLPIPNREVKPVRADGTAYSGRVGSRRPFRLSAALEKVSPQRHSFFCSTLLFFFCSTLLLISCLLFSQFISGAFNCFTLASRLLLDGYSLFSKYSCARAHWRPAILAY